jgi:regulator of protease activity HflC (stomatin/prohibitin superfamily)
MILVEQDSYGFVEDNGHWMFLPSGRHFLSSPLAEFRDFAKKSQDTIVMGPIKIIRIDLGSFGLAEENASQVILLPGVHAHNDARWKLIKTVKQDSPIISHGPVKFVTVKSGFVQVCYIRGQVQVYPWGRYAFNDPTIQIASQIDLFSRDVFTEGPMTLVRVKLGHFGFADHNASPVVLLPGLHLVKDTKFKFSSFAAQNREYIEHGPLKFFIVRTGTCRACYVKGVLEIVHEGRYAVNDISFLVREEIKLMQQNINFPQHGVLLLGGVKMIVEGLLTFQITDPHLLMQKIGVTNLIPSIENMGRAELSRVFSTLHIEDITSERVAENAGNEVGQGEHSVLAPDTKRAEGEPRSMICHNIVQQIAPMVAKWGVTVIAFQIESIQMADQKYASEYEQASLATARAKANLRAQNAQNDILITKAKASAESQRILAEGQKAAATIIAQAEADCRKLEANSRNEAALAMKDAFGQKYALVQQEVEFANNLKAQTLTVPESSIVGHILKTQGSH